MDKNGKANYSQKLWSEIKKEWLNSQLSMHEISRAYGPSRQAILSRARREAWPPRGTLAEVVRREIITRIMIEDNDVRDAGAVAGAVTPVAEGAEIEPATRGGPTVVRNHKWLLARLFSIIDVTLYELERLEDFHLESLKKTRKKHRTALLTALIKTKTEAMRAVSQALSQVIPLERQAFLLDKDGGEQVAPAYMAPDYDKPMESGLGQ